jgi:hypothetical protein
MRISLSFEGKNLVNFPSLIVELPNLKDVFNKEIYWGKIEDDNNVGEI